MPGITFKCCLVVLLTVCLLPAAEAPTLTEPVVAKMRILEQRRPVGSSSWTTTSERDAVQARSRQGDTVQDGILGPRSVRLFNANERRLYTWFHGSSEVSSIPSLSRTDLRKEGPSIEQIAQKAIRVDTVAGYPCHVFGVMMGNPRGGPPTRIGETCHSLEYDIILRHEFTHVVGDEEVRHVAEATSFDVSVEPGPSMFQLPGR